MKQYDVIVAGGGHAGIEAASAAAHMGCSTALITMEKEALGRMSCNPAIGGTAKGHLVHEIDALGGVMGGLADRTGIQFRVLNLSKGPAVWSSRCQSDRELYSKACCELIEKINNLTVIEEMVADVITENDAVKGIRLSSGEEFGCLAFIVAAGTFLNGLMYTGLESTEGGRFAEPAAMDLTAALLRLGIKSGRLKTGTPPRLAKDSIDYSRCEEQVGDENPIPFSLETDRSLFPFLSQISCHLTYTNELTHKILEKGFDRSPLFTGLIKGVGPRYCPSIEDKIVRFADKKRHHLFLEPEGLTTDMVYVNGFPTSLPVDIQKEAIASVPGLEDAKMIRPGYAVEYDFFPAWQIRHTLEVRSISGLYFAGQINGTSGYEEAAALGLMAGINAVLKIQKRDAFILKRSEAYIGVLIDDLINKAPEEPYRMFTSRAEYRLLLRQDNADRRLRSYGHELGLVTDTAFEKYKERKKMITSGISGLHDIKIKPDVINHSLSLMGTNPVAQTVTVAEICKRPQVSLTKIVDLLNETDYPFLKKLMEDGECFKQVEVELKYEGYIKRQQIQVARFEKLENKKIPEDFPYTTIKTLSNEARDKLDRIRPITLGQASRIPGVSPADITALMIHLRSKS